MPLHRRLIVEDRDRDRSFRHRRTIRLRRDDELASQSFILRHPVPEKLCQPPRRADGRRLLSSVLGERLGHAPVLGDEFDEFVVSQARSFALEDVQPLIGDLRDGGVALLGCRSEKELFEDLSLEDLDELELSSSFDLESLEFRERVVVVEDGVSFLEKLVLLLRRREDHRLVGTVKFEEDRVLRVDFVASSFLVDEIVVLVVGELGVDEVVEHRAGVGDSELLPSDDLEGEVLGKRSGKHAPDSVGIEFERTTDLLDELTRHLDDRRSGEAGDSSHLHRVPTSSLPHNVSVEGVEDDLVGELERVVDDDHSFGFRDLCYRIRLLESLLPRLVKSLVLVTTISERSDGVDVERVLPLADDGFLDDDLGFVSLSVDLPGVVSESLVEESRLFRLGEIDEPTLRSLGPLGREGFLFESVLDHVELVSFGGEVLSSPSPLHPTIARLVGSVVVARRAHGFVDDRVGLESIRQHDVGIHGGDVEMVDERVVEPSGGVS